MAKKSSRHRAGQAEAAAAFSPLAMTRSRLSDSLRRGKFRRHHVAARLADNVADEENAHSRLLTQGRARFQRKVGPPHSPVGRLDCAHGGAAVLARRQLALAAGLGVSGHLRGRFGRFLSVALSPRSGPAALAPAARSCQQGQARWDKIFMACAVLAWNLWLVLMALDAQRWRTVVTCRRWLEVVGGALIVAGLRRDHAGFRGQQFRGARRQDPGRARPSS